MNKKKSKSSKTTRNPEFNYYDDKFKRSDIDIRNVVVSSTANKKKGVENIRLLDVNDAVVKTGGEIASDALQNTNLIELNMDVKHSIAMILFGFALNGRPENEAMARIYDKTEIELQKDELSFVKIHDSMILDYTEYLGEDTKYYIYGAPEKMVLNNRQNYNNCGVESTLNTLVMAGIIKMSGNLKSQKKTEKTFLKSVLELGLAQDSGKMGVLDEDDGGTLPDDYKDILAYFDIDSEAYYISRKCDGNQYSDINELAYKISQGYGAILGVSSTKLWKETQSESGKIAIDHAVAITGVVYDTDEISPEVAPVGFYIHDTGAWMTRFISIEEFKDVTLYDYYGYKAGDDNLPDGFDSYDSEMYLDTLREFDTTTRETYSKDKGGLFVTITKDPIKAETFNINATGDKYDNILYGNSGENVVKGMSGNDILFGGAGDDEIRGGKGNDIIFGNGKNYEAVELLNNLIGDDLTDVKELIEKIGKTDYVKSEDVDKNMHGVNLIYGENGKDIIFGGNDADLIYGGKGNDYIYAGSGRNAVYGGKGNDIVAGGSNSDRLFGDSGKDIIYGFGDDDVIFGGTGNDTLYGGRGDDIIETGKGDDTVVIEGKLHGTDLITSQSGNTHLKFMDESGSEENSKGAKISEMNFELSRNEDSFTSYDLKIGYCLDLENSDDGVQFSNVYDSNKNKSKSLTIEDSDNKKYSLSVTDKEIISTDKKSENTILLSTNMSKVQITTGDKDDIVYMGALSNEWSQYYNIENVYDEITYKGGNDRYVSVEKNTRYYVDSFDSNTQLTIADNLVGLTKKQFTVGIPEYPASFHIIEINNVVSTDDRLYFSTDISDLNFLFDVKVNASGEALTTDKDTLFILANDDVNMYKSFASGDWFDNKGYVSVEGFFKDECLFEKNDKDEYLYNGNGKIESVYCKSDSEYTAFDLDAKIAEIAGNVAEWLSNHTEYSSAYDAIAKNNAEDISTLIAYYSGN